MELARNNLKRGEELVPSGGISKEDFDQRSNALKVANEREKEAWAGLQETRAQLGLPPDYKNPLDIPKELENEQSTVQSAVSQIASSLAEIGIAFDPKDADQAKAFADFLRPGGTNRPAKVWKRLSTPHLRSRSPSLPLPAPKSSSMTR